MSKYRIKPENVEAEKYDRDWNRIVRWLGPHLTKTEPSPRDPQRDVAMYVFDIKTKGWVHVPPLSYVIKDSEGALSVLPASEFEAKWEPMPSNGVPTFPILPGVRTFPSDQPLVTYGGESGNR